MGGVLGILALLGYLFLLVDWKELRATLAAGGWGACTVYAIVTILIVAVLSCPATAPVAGGHHG